MVYATFTDGDALYCLIPSKSKNGVYFVEVKPNGRYLVVTHSCPALQMKKKCSHVQEALDSYRAWKWWEQYDGVKTKTYLITLQPKWEQIPVPGSIADVAKQIIEGDPNAT